MSEWLSAQELVEENMQIMQKDAEIRNLNEKLIALSDAMNAMQRSNETKLSEASAMPCCHPNLA